MLLKRLFKTPNKMNGLEKNNKLFYFRFKSDSPPVEQKKLPYDGATAAAHVAYAFSEQAFIYPITPATPMGEVMANWQSAGRKNLFSQIVNVTQMQSEAGAAGACHGVVDVGSLASTFTSSQGLLLMVPNMYIIAGALNPCVFHVAARSVTKHALCIFGDHTDVMATRQTGFSILSAKNVQEAMDMALVSHISTLKSSVPFMNFFDGFRTSHEINKIKIIPYDAMEKLVPWEDLKKFRQMGLNPNRPHSRQLGQFSDSFFQNSEAANKVFEAVPGIVQKVMDDVGDLTGRYYKLMQFEGHKEPEFLTVVMGSGSSTVKEAVDYANERGEKFGMITVHLYRPWDSKTLLDNIPKSVKRIAVLDRTKEQTALGEPLFMDVSSTLQSHGRSDIEVIGGRYGLGSKEFTPAMALAVFDNLKKENPVKSFSVGIEDDVTFRSLPLGTEPDVLPEGTKQCIFWGMGSDGTLSANKNAIKLIADNTDLSVQAYFAYDSKKAGGCTISHLRFGPKEIDSPYAIVNADFVACSQPTWPSKFPKVMLETLKGEGKGTAVFNTSVKTTEEFAKTFPIEIINAIGEKKAKLYVIDASKVARECGLGRHTNNILQSVFFKLSKVLPYEQASDLLKSSMKKQYAHKGEELIKRNLKGLEDAVNSLIELKVPHNDWAEMTREESPVDGRKSTFVKDIMEPLNALEGNKLPVSAFDPRGHFPPATTQFEKRGIALTVPIVDMDKCTQCNKCAMICPHAAIRPFLISQLEADKAPSSFDMRKAQGGNEVAGMMFRIQVAPEDCTGCEACSWACPDEALTMTPLSQVIDVERPNWSFAESLPSRGHMIDKSSVRGSQFQKPLLEFSGACEGCGETPYAKLVTQLFGHRMVIANASGCSSVWAGTAAFNPLAVNEKGQGPAWGRSLFEDAAEYGMGMARALTDRREALAVKVKDVLEDEDFTKILGVDLTQKLTEWHEQRYDPDISQELADFLPTALKPFEEKIPPLRQILVDKDLLPKLSFWVWGGDGWAYDIGFGGLDHVLASKQDLNVLVMDTEGYSNTGGQVSKATNLGAVQKFAPSGYKRSKKDLGALAMAYKDIYVASIAIGANYGQSVKALLEAESYRGPSLVLCYSPCIEHKILFPRGLSRLAEEMKLAVDSGYWTLYRYNPELLATGKNPFSLDSKRLAIDVKDFTKLENRFMILERTHPEKAKLLKTELQQWVVEKHEHYKALDKEVAIASTITPMGPELNILYGSDTGTTAELAKRLGFLCKSRNFNVKVFELNEIAPSALREMKNVVILCSTAGEGDMPATATDFWENLKQDLPKDYLNNVTYSAFGLGDTGYRHFNRAIINLDQRLEELGAKRLQQTGLGNDKDSDKYETAFDTWLPELWKVTNAPEDVNADKITEPIVKISQVEENVLKRAVKVPFTKTIKLVKNDRITSRDYDRTIRHLVFDLKPSDDFSYLLGDALIIYPDNNPEIVDEFLGFYNLDKNAFFKVEANGEQVLDNRRRTAFRHPIRMSQIFGDVLDILGRPNKHFYKQLSKFATDPKEKAALNLLASDSEEGKKLYSELAKETVTYFDVLKMFPSSKPPVEQLISFVPLIKPRLYSIASSQRLVNDKVELVIVILDWKTPKGKARRGLGTDYVQRLALDQDKMEKNASSFSVQVSVAPGTFKFPSDPRQPYVMTGLGTGLAPFRAFIQERAFLKRMGQVETGPMWLFYGCRYKEKDYIFGQELEQYHKEGVLTELRPAFSRDQNKKVYVQDRMAEVKERLYDDLIKKNGFFYMCGQAGKLEQDVREALIQAIEAGGKMSRKEAEAEFDKFDKDHRYCLELY